MHKTAKTPFITPYVSPASNNRRESGNIQRACLASMADDQTTAIDQRYLAGTRFPSMRSAHTEEE
jgi:hypothetical protein